MSSITSPPKMSGNPLSWPGGQPKNQPENKEAEEAERKLLLKIDWFILSFCCAAFFCNYLDRSNINNAYVSGMKEDLNMHGNQITRITAVFTAGYIIGMIPNNLMILRFAPHIWFPFTMFAWGILTLGTFRVTSVSQIYIIRFFQGIFESSTFVGTQYILGSWYTSSELGKRTALFTASGLLGQMVSGALQSGIHKTLHNRHGIAGWRWLFIIDACITIPIAVYGFVLFPDTPERARVGYLTAEEKRLAMERLPKREDTRLDWSVWKRVLGRWHCYAFAILWAIGGELESLGKHNLLGLYLQDMGRSISDRNNYPMVGFAIGIIATLLSGVYIDLTGQHWHVGLYVCVMGIVSSVMILVYRPESLIFAGHYIAGQVWCVQTVFFAWANWVCRRDKEERSIVLATMNISNNAWTVWWSLTFFSADMGPRFTRGCWAMIACGIVLAVCCTVIKWMQDREEKSRKEEIPLEEIEGQEERV
ncbi:major facilitator superfamily domain-containing protein [Pyronema omphalodes]|nr:major facilitator superfamily domain-containing protein [Pyronema omphalodes]